MRTLAIVGSHPLTRESAPYGDSSVDIWVFNEVVSLGNVPRADAVFQMHAPPIWKNPLNRNDSNHYSWLQTNQTIPVYMLENYPEVPMARAYPMEAVCDALLSGLFDRRYFTSSVAYALALGIYYGYERIELHGVEMETNTEYFAQRDGVFFWLGIALGRGIQVYVPEVSGLFRAPLYGYEGDIALKGDDFTARAGVLRELAEKAKARVEAAKAEYPAAFLACVTAAPVDREKAKQRLYTAVKEQNTAVIEWGALAGAIAENDRYLTKANAMTDAAGGVLFSRQEFEQTAAKAQEDQAQYDGLMHQTGARATDALKLFEAEQKQGASRSRRERAAQAYFEAHNKRLEAAYHFGMITGVVNENVYYLQRVDELVRAAGGSKSEAVLLAARQEAVIA